MPRQRPLAGQRGRSRLGTGVLDPGVDDSAETPAEEPTALGTAPAGATETRPDAPPDLPAAPRERPVRRRPGRSDPLVLLAVLVVVALALTAGTLALRARSDARAEDARTQAVAAAESDAVDLLSYDYRHLDRDFARAHKDLTGSFADDYARTTKTVVRPTATQVKAVVKADVAASSVVRSSENQVVVLLFVNQTTTSTRLDGPKVDLDRVRMTLDRVHGQWLVSKVVAL